MRNTKQMIYDIADTESTAMSNVNKIKESELPLNLKLELMNNLLNEYIKQRERILDDSEIFYIHK